MDAGDLQIESLWISNDGQRRLSYLKTPGQLSNTPVNAMMFRLALTDPMEAPLPPCMFMRLL